MTRHPLDGLGDEIRDHIERETAENIERGMSPEEARLTAKRAFGSTALPHDYARDVWISRWLQEILRDVRFAIRALGRNRTFALVSVLTLALGIGANTFVFTVINSLLLAPLPVDRPGEIVFIQGGASDGIGQSFPNYRDIRDHNTTFAGVIGYRIAPMSVEWSTGARRAWGYLATDNYFHVLGIQPALGRFFDRTSNTPVAVLSHEAWRAQYASDPTIIGRTIRINRQPFTIVGVAPEGFHGIEHVFDSDLWVPMSAQPLIEPGRSWLESRRTFNVWLAARMKSGVSPAAVQADLTRLADDLARTYPADNEGLTLTTARPGLIGDALRTPLQGFSWAVLALAALVLLTACANLSSLLAARGADRQREIAVRVSLGASRSHIIRQFLTEALLLAATGGVVGALLAVVASRALSQWQIAAGLPMRLTMSPDAHVFVFTAATSLIAGLLFSLAPAWQSTRTDPNATLKGHTPWFGSRWGTRDILLGVQVAISVVLLAACFLSVRGLRQALTMPLGFEPNGLAMAGVDLGLAGYSSLEAQTFQDRLLEEVRRLPGVDHAAYASSIPLYPDHSTNRVFAEDQPADEPAHSAEFYRVSAGFFDTMGIPLRYGRDFDAGLDDIHSPHVAIVNEAFARRVFRSVQATGRRFRYSRTGPLFEVVGVTGDGKYQTLTEAPRPAIFAPLTQSPAATGLLIVKSSLPAGAITASVRDIVARQDSAVSLFDVGPVSDAIGLTLLPNRAAAWALTGFGMLALLLAATGIHGMVASALARRRHELGIHAALGAPPAHILCLVFGRMVFVLATGTAAGLFLAFVMAPVMSQIVYLTSPRDPATLLGAALALIAFGGLACLRPAIYAIRVDPMTALRCE